MRGSRNSTASTQCIARPARSSAQLSCSLQRLSKHPHGWLAARVCATGQDMPWLLTVVALRVAQVHLILDGPPGGGHALTKAEDDLQQSDERWRGWQWHSGRRRLGAGGGLVGSRASLWQALADANCSACSRRGAAG